MPDSKRQCATCQFFQSAQLAGNGWCTHPKRQVASDVKILVREKELACRNSWGDDLWLPKSSHATTQPAPARQPQPFTLLNQQVDDEVTSVVDKEDQAALGNASEDVVTVTSVRPDHDRPAYPSRRRPDDLNTPANDDQAERVRLMARGSGAALSGARERMRMRRSPVRPAIDPDPSTSEDADQILNAQDREQYTPPDRPLTPPTSTPEFPATPPVPRAEVEARRNTLAESQEAANRFDSVPSVKPEVALPRLREFFRPGAPGALAGASSTGAPMSSFEMVVRRAQEIKAEAGTRQGQEPRRRPVPPSTAEPVPEPEPESFSSIPEPSEAAVVWDVQTDLIQVAFARARDAISPVERQDPPVPAIDDASDWPLDEARPIETPPYPDDTHLEAELVARLAPREEGFDEPAPPPRFTQVSESPRGSWWRSLNFRKKRQAQHEPEYEDYVTYAGDPGYDDRDAGLMDDDGYELEAGDEAWLADDGYGIGQVAGDALYDGYDLDDDDPGGAWLEPDPRYEVGPVADAYETDLLPVTSEASWLEDERAFPEPQPAAWHDERSHLLASRIPLEPLVLPETEPSFPTPEPVPVDPRRESQREPAPYYALDQPGGFNAFRAALFGGADPNDGGHDQWAIPPTGESSLELTPEEPEPAQPRSPRQPAREPARYAGRSTHGRRERGWESPSSLKEAIDEQDEEPRQAGEMASGIPKCCATCRSFLPDADGRRGRCTNDWASTHRQMVNAEDLACRSSIGDWWLADDTSWIPPVDRIQPETPRADRLAARHDHEDEMADARRSRVRTRKVV